MNRPERILFAAVLGAGVLVNAPTARAQVNLERRSVELGFAREWFRRDMEPAAFRDTRWDVTSVVLRYGAFDRITIGVQGALADYESPDYAGSAYRRYTVGADATVRAYRVGAWELTARARYLDTWDRDDSYFAFHRRERRAAAGVELVRRFDVYGQPLAVWGGPAYANDRIENEPWDTHRAIVAGGQSAWGAAAGARAVLKRYAAVFGYASYLDRFQGGVGVALHADGGVW
jgi:hypothetical protein